MNKIFTDEAWDDYMYWHTQDKKTLNRINKLIGSIDRDPFDGIGKPEPLKLNIKVTGAAVLMKQTVLCIKLRTEICI